MLPDFKRICVLFLLLANCAGIEAQDTKTLPLNIISSGSDNAKSLVIYITGDGGWNQFSQGFTKELASRGYPVVSLNANKYFWKKKTPVQAATDLNLVIDRFLKEFNRTRISIIGYSFGADVLPFIYNKLPADIQTKIKSINLLSPSPATDFEIHLMAMMGGSGGGNSVADEVNRLGNVPLTIITGDSEKDFPFEKVTAKKFRRKSMAGGHHYDGDVKKLVDVILENAL